MQAADSGIHTAQNNMEATTVKPARHVAAGLPLLNQYATPEVCRHEPH